MSSSSNTARWEDAHRDPQGPGDKRPTALDIVKDEQLEGKWDDKVALVTGASSGIGLEIVRALHATGATVFMAVRDVEKGAAVAKDIEAKSGSAAGKLEVLHVDLASVKSVCECAAAFLAKSKKLNVLICNAGVLAPPLSYTADGFEMQFAVNHLAHFLLFQMLKPALLASSTPTFHSRVITVSATGHHVSGVNFDDYHFKKTGYEGISAYAQSKTANIYMASEIERRYGSQGVHGISVAPGSAATGLQKHLSDYQVELFTRSPAVRRWIKSVEQAAATPVWAATAAALEGKGWLFLEDCQVAKPAVHFFKGYAPHAADSNAAKRLYDDSLTMLGL